MFGYVRPVRQELKCGEFDLYRATYCGLCRCLRRRYGPVAPMFLSYDLTFLALLLWEPEESFQPCSGRCHANPLIKKPMCPSALALDRAADASVILTWWKLKDSQRDDGLVGGMPARALAGVLYPSYHKAAKKWPEFDAMTRICLEELSQREEERCSSIDRTADTFARILQAAVPEGWEQQRILGQLLYHLGRWIYLVDARDDLEEDKKAGRYNPLQVRYGPQGDDDALALTLDQSRVLMGAALQLGEFGCRKPILENIIYLGLPLVERAVFDGSWAQIKKQKIWSNRQ
ncbi:DUF5685 family protein [Flavonifractor sp. An100]|uniref:DUF5685 family protein n=1 Tax=Flavonifractor sp. An100 TaxID=1965538 RepID=UPI000B395A29|nr:DUF5685 family protein [Flavonifractor sp. An100]OUQ80569.1 hypothetical protein B5E43_03440 [Flavonifractor sp. An100]